MALDMDSLSKKFDANHRLRIGAEKGSVELIQDALKRGADPESTGKESTWTSLMIVAEGGNVSAAKALVDARANIEYRSMRGISPLLVAINNNKVEMAEFLLKCGAEMYANYEADNTPRDNAKTQEMKELLDKYDPKSLYIRRQNVVEDILNELNRDKVGEANDIS